MTHKLVIELRTGGVYRDPTLREGRTPSVGEKLCVKTGDRTINCRVETVAYGAIPHSQKTFEDVDDVHAKEE
jgi:hypothetical protein